MTTHLFVRSSYTLLDSTIRIEELVNTAKEMGYTSIALTDHNVMHGCVHFYQLCQKAGIKAIIGMEVDCLYHDEVVPFVLLCKDNIGYQNLMKLSSLIQSEKSYCDINELSKYSEHTHIIAYGEGGYIDSDLISENVDSIRMKLKQMKEELPAFDIALSYQESSLWRIKNKLLKNICATLSIHTVALNKIYYLHRSDDEIYRALCGIRLQKNISDQSLVLNPGRYFLTMQEMARYYGEDDLRRTDEIAQECSCNLNIPKTQLPVYDVPDGINSAQYLTQLCIAGLKKRLNQFVTPAYKARLKHELDIIIRMHFEDYFLIVYDFIRYARQHHIYVGPGRGSAAGSLVAYCLGITQIDPLKYHLLFERFLNPERVSMPDIDTDIPDNRRQEVIHYVFEKYGENHVADIITFGTLGAKQVLRDVGKYLNLPLRDIDMLAKLVPNTLKITLDSALKQNHKLSQIVNADARFQKLFRLALRLEGLPRHTSTHAGGIVLSRLNLEDVIPTMQVGKDIKTTQYTMEFLEDIGLIKMDFLGLRNLSIIDEIVTNIKKENPDFDIMSIPLDDSKTYRIFQSCDTTGIFQFESSGMKNLLRKMQADHFNDLVAALALFRPGPMENIPQYLINKKNPENITYPDDRLKDVLKDSYGIMIYQEQIMLLARIIGVFSLAKADILRKAMSKKNEKAILALKADFINGCIQNGSTNEKAEYLFSLVEKFAGYGFNKSHAVAYATVAYQLAYLKANYPLYFYLALLNGVIGDEEKVSQYVDECRRRNIKIFGPNIMYSTAKFMILNQAIVFPLTAIKTVGQQITQEVIKEREIRQYSDYFDFVARMAIHKLNSRVLEFMIDAGALDCFGYSRKTLKQSISDAFNYADLVRVEQNGFTQINLDLVSKPILHLMKDNEEEKSELEKLCLGIHLGIHPIVNLRSKLNISYPSLIQLKMKTGNHKGFALIQSVRQHRTKKGDLMAFIKLSDETANMDMAVMPRLYQVQNLNLVKGKYILFDAKISEDGSCLANAIRVVGK